MVRLASQVLASPPLRIPQATENLQTMNSKRCDALFNKWMSDHAGIVANYNETTQELMRSAWRAAWQLYPSPALRAKELMSVGMETLVERIDELVAENSRLNEQLMLCQVVIQNFEIGSTPSGGAADGG